MFYLVLIDGQAQIGFDLLASLYTNEDDAYRYIAGELGKDVFEALSDLREELISTCGFDPDDWDLDTTEIPDVLLQYVDMDDLGERDYEQLIELLEDLAIGTVYPLEADGVAHMVIMQGGFA